MQTRNPLFNDLAKVAGAAMGVAGGMRDELEGQVRARLERILTQMDLVTREDFEAVREMAAKARDEQETLRQEVAALRAEIETLKTGGKPAAAAKAKTAKKPARKTASGQTGEAPKEGGSA